MRGHELLKRKRQFAGRIWPYLLLTCLLPVFNQCSQPEGMSLEQRVGIEVADKLAGWRSRRDATCREAALTKAYQVADSLILEYAREQKLQLDRPSRPLRPDEPELQRPSDTLKLAPFLDSL